MRIVLFWIKSSRNILYIVIINRKTKYKIFVHPPPNFTKRLKLKLTQKLGMNFDNLSQTLTMCYETYERDTAKRFYRRLGKIPKKKQKIYIFKHFSLPLYQKLTSTAPLISLFFVSVWIIAENRECLNLWNKFATLTHTKTSTIPIPNHT